MDYFAGLDIPMDETHVAFSSGKARVPKPVAAALSVELTRSTRVPG
jgi:hypothetical protein